MHNTIVAVVGGAVLLAIVLIIVCVCRWKNHKRDSIDLLPVQEQPKKSNSYSEMSDFTHVDIYNSDERSTPDGDSPRSEVQVFPRGTPTPRQSLIVRLSNPIVFICHEFMVQDHSNVEVPPVARPKKSRVNNTSWCVMLYTYYITSFTFNMKL